MAIEAYIRRRERFSAAHHYRLPHLSEEEARKTYGPLTTHGHNYMLEVTTRGPIGADTGMVENLKSLKAVIRQEAIANLDNLLLNEDVAYFRSHAPTLENLSGYIWERLAPHYQGDRLYEVRLAEHETLYVERRSGSGEMYLTRGYHFCAAHRLHQPDLNEKKNRELFGKCNNPHGHGHNYRVEITIAGEVDERTGTIANVGELDRIVDEQVLEYFDHKHLNIELDEFRELNPTAENIARVIWNRIGEKPGGARLYRVKLYETERNIAEFYGG